MNPAPIPLPVTAADLPILSTIALRGANARNFLQGQLSADLDALGPQRAQLASCNSAQGRVQAVLWIVQRSDGIALVLPASMVESIAARLRKYVLRAKVEIDADALKVVLKRTSNCAAPATDRDLRLQAMRPLDHFEDGGISHLRLPGHDSVLLLTQDATGSSTGAHSSWRLEGIRAGLPQVYPQTHEAFVAQMLNLDLLGGIDFEKGCYTGQEIIARTHYRGAIKRRMLRYAAQCPPPAPGVRVLAGEAHAGDVVDAAPTEEGCEMLIVVSLAQRDRTLALEISPAAALEPLPLPYAVA